MVMFHFWEFIILNYEVLKKKALCHFGVKHCSEEFLTEKLFMSHGCCSVGKELNMGGQQVK